MRQHHETNENSPHGLVQEGEWLPRLGDRPPPELRLVCLAVQAKPCIDSRKRRKLSPCRFLSPSLAPYLPSLATPVRKSISST